MRGFITPVRITLASALFGAFLMIGGCARQPKAADVSSNVRNALNQAGLKDVSVTEDRDKGVVTLGGKVISDDQKSQADSIAKSNAGNLVVANEVAVVPPNDASAAKTVNSDVDAGIKKNLDAALVQNRLNKVVKYSVKNGVVTLKGSVNSQGARSQAENIASQVPNVTQVVNELDVRYSRATSQK